MCLVVKDSATSGMASTICTLSLLSAKQYAM